jgi:excisionase family DNA binding protein
MRDTSEAGAKKSAPTIVSLKRGYSRVEAAAYVGVSTTTFDQLVSDGRLPKAKRIGRRKVWDIRELDPAFEDLGSIDTSWDDVE